VGAKKGEGEFSFKEGPHRQERGIGLKTDDSLGGGNTVREGSQGTVRGENGGGENLTARKLLAIRKGPTDSFKKG